MIHATLFLDGGKQCFLPRRGNVTENDGGLCLIAWFDARPVAVGWGHILTNKNSGQLIRSNRSGVANR